MSNDRTALAVAALGTAYVLELAVTHPAQIPALGLAVAAFMAILAFLRL